MPSYAIYNSDGKILKIISGEKTSLVGLNTPLDCKCILYKYSPIEVENYYIKNDKLTLKPVMTPTVSKTSIAANSIDIVYISNLPAGSIKCSILTPTGDHKVLTITDGALDFTTDQRGVYNLTFEQFPYQPYEVTINAV